MRTLATHFTYQLALTLLTTSMVFADATEPDEFPSLSTTSQTTLSSFAPFTGKITKNKVRMRYQASLDGPILRELNEGDLLVVVGETEDFYAVKPPSDIKGYVFRTFVLDNHIEGKNVNVRLEPLIDAPIIGQLNSGDRVEGKVSPLNNKWLEIDPPEATRFFVAKDYLEKAGGPNMIAVLEKRRQEVNTLLNSTYLLSQTEMQKSFPEINLDTIIGNYNQVIKSYSDFPEQTARAKDLLLTIQDHYLQKKIAYLEAKAHSSPEWHAQNYQKNDPAYATEDHLEKSTVEPCTSLPVAAGMPLKEKVSPNVKMAIWLPVEENLYQEWLVGCPGDSKADFYEKQKEHSVILTGIVEPYTRSVKNKPGDYLLVDQCTHQPIAYLYSTFVDLNKKLGQEVQVLAAPRSNNNFAFPAYFVLSTK